jgi:lipopolysaccharide transport system permease protein
MKSQKMLVPDGIDGSVSQINNNDTKWTTIIETNYRWVKIDFSEIWRYRDLIILFVWRDFVSQYKQTILGPLWFILQPLFTTLIFTIVFGQIARIPTDGVPPFLFYLSGTVCWTYFASCLTQTADTFVTNAAIFGKVYFPRMVIPISTVISQVLKFFIQLVLFIIFLGYFYIKGASLGPSLWVLALPFLMIQMALLGLGCGILVSSLTTKYRDLTLLVSFGIQLWMYATPVVYPLSQIPEKYRSLFSLNPMASVVECFRAIFLGTSSINASFIVIGWAITLAVLFTGMILFTRIEKTFVDTV